MHELESGPALQRGSRPKLLAAREPRTSLRMPEDGPSYNLLLLYRQLLAFIIASQRTSSTPHHKRAHLLRYPRGLVHYAMSGQHDRQAGTTCRSISKNHCPDPALDQVWFAIYVSEDKLKCRALKVPTCESLASESRLCNMQCRSTSATQPLIYITSMSARASPCWSPDRPHTIQV